MNGKFKHTPTTAARVVRAMFAGQIATTWDQYADQAAKRGSWLNSYTAAKIVQEQCGCDFRAASGALGEVIPELFAEYWEALPVAA